MTSTTCPTTQPPAYAAYDYQTYATQQPKTNVNFMDANALFHKIEELQKVHGKACSEFARVNSVLQSKGEQPIDFEAACISSYTLNGSMPFDQIVMEMKDRVVTLQGRIYEIAKKNLEADTRIQNIEKIRVYVENLYDRQPRSSEPLDTSRFRHVQISHDREFRLPSAKEIQNLVFWGVFASGLMTNTGLITSFVLASLAQSATLLNQR